MDADEMKLIEEQRAALTMMLVVEGYPVPVFDKPYAYMEAKTSVYPADVRRAIYYLSEDPEGIEIAVSCPVYLRFALTSISSLPRYTGEEKWE